MKLIKGVMIFLAISLVFAPVSFAWNWNAHSKIVDSTYNSLPSSVQSKLSLSYMEDGSNDPDQVFHDFRDHSYPFSYTKAVYYLNKGASYYKQKKYYLASISFGIASHYISDTFSAPHCVSGELYSEHASYEYQANKLTPHITKVNGNLKTLLYNGYITGKSDWKSWMLTHSSSYPQKDMNMAASVSAMAIRNVLGVNGPINTVPVTTDTYVGNYNTKKFHLSSCYYADEISTGNKVYFSSRQAAINNGYVACKVCNP
jgi:Zinc dependent phospholipase C